MASYKYQPNPQHRGALPLHQKSQWLIPVPEEVSLFDKAYKEAWSCPKGNLWSIDDDFKIIGKDIEYELRVAKFWSNQDIWHGFPVSMKREVDRPPTIAIQSWVKKRIIRKKDGIKMSQGRFK